MTETKRVSESALPGDKTDLLRLQTLALLATNDPEQAHEALSRVVQAPLVPGQSRLELLVRDLEDHLGRLASFQLSSMDELQFDNTRDLVIDEAPILGDPTRVPVLLGELRRRCLGCVLLALPPANRLAFILVDVLSLPKSEATVMLGARLSTLECRLGRARRSLARYLEPRCGHLDRRNPCSCERRLGTALDKGFVRMPKNPGRTLPLPPRPSLPVLYRSVPISADHELASAPTS